MWYYKDFQKAGLFLYYLVLISVTKETIAVFYTEHLAYLLDCLACYEIMAGKNLVM